MLIQEEFMRNITVQENKAIVKAKNSLKAILDKDYIKRDEMVDLVSSLVKKFDPDEETISLFIQFSKKVSLQDNLSIVSNIRIFCFKDAFFIVFNMNVVDIYEEIYLKTDLTESNPFIKIVFQP
jgi:hypothetical protein